MVRLPAPDPVLPQEPVAAALRRRPGFVPRVAEQAGTPRTEAGVDGIPAHLLHEVDRGKCRRRHPYIPREDHVLGIDGPPREPIARSRGHATYARHVDDVDRQPWPERHPRCRRADNHRGRTPRGDGLDLRGEVVGELRRHVRCRPQPHHPSHRVGARQGALLSRTQRGAVQHGARGHQEGVDLHTWTMCSNRTIRQIITRLWTVAGPVDRFRLTSHTSSGWYRRCEQTRQSRVSTRPRYRSDDLDPRTTGPNPPVTAL